MKIITQILWLAVFSASSNTLHAEVNSKIFDVDIGQGLANETGRDGRTVVFPLGWKTKEGKDGRIVAYPLGWFEKEGKDGRLVAYPLGWFDREGKDGRIVAYPLGWFKKEGKDGRLVAYPLGWFDREGKDGRIVVVPNANPAPLLLIDAANVAAAAEMANADKHSANLVAVYYWVNTD